jgi:hypothetical protein
MNGLTGRVMAEAVTPLTREEEFFTCLLLKRKVIASIFVIVTTKQMTPFAANYRQTPYWTR